MNVRRLLILLVLAIFIICSYLLAVGSPLLTKPFLGLKRFPIGNAVAWAGLVSFPLLFWLIGNLRQATTAAGKMMRTLVLIALALGAGWGFMSRWMSGNWLFNFTNAPEPIRNPWHYYTGAILFLPLLALIFYLSWHLFQKIRNNFRKL